MSPLLSPLRPRLWRPLPSLLPVLAVAGCIGGGGGGGGVAADSPDIGEDSAPTPDTVPPAGGMATATRADLRLKRWRQLQLDLEGALQLPGDALCRETGLYDCTDLHVVPLGGVSVPNGLYRPVDTISATTGLAIERLVMQACFNRLQADRALVAEGGAAVVFSAVDLSAGTADDAALAAQVTGLYRRLLARDPVEAEVDALAALHGTLGASGGQNADWALMSCFAVGTTTEALTY